MNLKWTKALRFIFRFLFWTSPFLAVKSPLTAQTCRWYPSSLTIQLDSLPIDPQSITVNDAKTGFSFQSTTGLLELLSEESDSVWVCYQPLNPLFLKPFYQRDIKTYSSGGAPVKSRNPVKATPSSSFELQDFQSNGSISRGVGFGNRQNVFVNSALNLQLEGQLAENLFVSASITDQNIPYQPEGNTQQIRDFDNVFIKFYNDDFDLTVGDIVFTNPVKDSYFLRYYKNVQGLQANTTQQLGRWQSKTTISGSVAKGQFASVQVDPIEGVQGPYRLTGPNGEQFLILLANSERVFIDGVELRRGFDRDYVIDYNQAEITFSPTILITRFTRIRVDFEYSEQFYGRSNFNLTQQFQRELHGVFFSFYQEKDNPANTLGFSPSDEDLAILSSLGNTSRGVISGVDSIGYVENSILYAQRDTLVSGELLSIYKFSTDESIALFRVCFSEVGQGNGSYALTQTTANGRIYEWVGSGNGAFEPIIRVPTPNKRQVSVLGSSHQVSAHEVLSQEFAFSTYDRNLYAPHTRAAIAGLAGKGMLTTSGRAIGSYKLEGNVAYEHLSTHFSAIDRFRSVEYDRNWGYNIFLDTVDRADAILTTQATLKRDSKHFIAWSGALRERTDVVSGQQFSLDAGQSVSVFQLYSKWFWLQNDPGTISNDWFRSVQEVNVPGRLIVPGYIFTLDQQKTAIGDSALSTVMHYHSHRFYLTSGDSLRAQFRLDYERRKDQLPQMGDFQPYTDAHEVRASSNFRFLGQTLNVTGVYREVKDLLADSKDDNILGRIDWKGSLWSRNIRHSLVYTTANSRELRREFVFVPVPTGQGTHTWRDENGDGIQDINEFYEAINADEKTFVKIFTPTTEYLTAFQTTLLHNVEMTLPSTWAQRGGAWKTISKFSLSANTSLNQKTTNGSEDKRLWPLGTDLRDADILSARNQYRYNLFYNRNGSGLAAETRYSMADAKSLLGGGFELQKRRDLENSIRFSLASGLVLRMESGWGITRFESDFLSSRNFQLNRTLLGPQVLWQPTSRFRLLGKVQVRTKSTPAEQIDFSKINEYGVESTWVQAGKGNLTAGLQWLSIRHKGEQNSYLGYELLEGLQPGQNQKWNVNWQQTVGKDLQLTLQYLGRKSPGTGVVHTGSMQLTAYF